MRKGETYFSDFDKTIKKRFHLFDRFGRVREIGPPFLAEASCQVEAIPGQNGAFIFDLTNVKK